MSTDQLHPDFAPNPNKQNATAEQPDTERLAHIIYGQVVKHFGLGTTHAFSSWSELPEGEQQKWIAAIAEVQSELKERSEKRH